MKIINNITDKLSDELKEKLEPGSKLSIAAACFSVYAFEELKTQLEGIDALRFIFTSPTFLAEQPEKAQREFYIPRLNREKTLYGSEFEIRLRNEFTQKAISRECAEWVRRKASFKSNVTSELMPGFMTVENAAPCAFAPVNGFTRADLGCERGGNMFSMINEIDAPESAAYTVRFDKEKLIESAVKMLDEKLNVTTVTVKLEYGEQAARLDSKEQLEQGHGFHRTLSDQEAPKTAPLGSVRYDLIGKLVEETKLTRATIAAILQRMAPQKFAMFRLNPEEFILKTAKIINDQMATQIIEHITYNKLDAAYDTDIFTSANLRGKLGLNAMEANRSLYSHIIYDSENEKRFAGELDVNAKVAVYVKLPGGFFISTPVGKYNPDWAIAFNEGSVKHIYFIAETKGNSDAAELRGVENAKIACAKAHFAAISSESVTYSVVDSFAELMNIVS